MAEYRGCYAAIALGADSAGQGKNTGQALEISGTMMSSPGALSSSFMRSSASHKWQPEKWTQAEQRLVSRNFLSSSLLKRPINVLIASKGETICSDVELAARRRGPALPLTVRKPRSFYLCALIVGALLLLLAITFNANPAEAAKCSGIRDSAQCAAQPDCHFDVNKRRCSQGPRPTEDACVVHVDKVVCTTDTTLGCGWSAEKKKCITKPR